MQLKDEISFVYRGSLTSGAIAAADCKEAKVVETYKTEDYDVESREGANVPEMETYIISSDIPEQ